jgi:hypothetical protein
MNTTFLVRATCLALSSVAAPAIACGDKLAMIGGGVSFDRVASATQPGNVVLLIAPDSPLSRADADLGLTDSLRRTGHSVRRVHSEAELQAALRQEQADVVVVYWTEADAIADAFHSDATTAPTVVPVAYRATPAQLADAAAQSKCIADVEKRRGKQLAETVDRVLAKRKAGLSVDCVAGANSRRST